MNIPKITQEGLSSAVTLLAAEPHPLHPGQLAGHLTVTLKVTIDGKPYEGKRSYVSMRLKPIKQNQP